MFVFHTKSLTISSEKSEPMPGKVTMPPQQSLCPPSSSSQNSARLSPTFKAIQEAGGLDGPKLAARPVSPKYAALQAFTESEQREGGSGSLQAPAQNVRSMSPTLLLIQQEVEEKMKPAEVKVKPAEAKVKPVQEQMSAVEHETKDGEEIHYHGYVDHNKQSKAFHILKSELDQGRRFLFLHVLLLLTF